MIFVKGEKKQSGNDSVTRRGKYTAIFVVPLVVFVLAIMMKNAAGPYWLGPNFDPSYQYLINSLHVLEGKTPSHFEHPGTTLQILGAVVIKAFHLFEGNRAVVDAVLTSPEFYLHAIFICMLIICILILICIGLYSFTKSGSILFAILIQSTAIGFCTYFKGRIVLPPIINISPEAMFIIVCYFYMFLVVKLYYKKDNNYFWITSMLGAVCAMGFVTKTTFLPLLILPVILLPGYKSKLMFLFSLILFSGTFLFPVRGEYSKIFYGFMGLAVHRNRFDYGAAQGSILDVDKFFSNLLLTLEFKPLWVISIVVSVITIISYFILKRKITMLNSNKYRKIFKFITALTLVSVGQILIVSKHYGEYYLIPAISLIGLLYGFYYLAIRELNISKKLVAAIIMIGVFTQTAYSMDYYRRLADLNYDLHRFSKNVYEKYSECMIINYYRSSSKKFALFFADSWGGKKEYADVLKLKYPNSFFYLSWDKDFRTFDEMVYLDNVDYKNNCVLVYGTRGQKFDGFVDCREIEFSRNEAISRIVSVASTQARLYYYSAKRFEKEKQFKKAFYAAFKAKERGFPNIEQYIRELGRQANIK